MSEAEYHDLVAAWLRESFVDVAHEPRVDLPADLSGEYVVPDFTAHTPFGDYVLEVEDDATTLYDGLGQALIYARATGHEPVAVFPADAGVEPGAYGPVHVETV